MKNALIAILLLVVGFIGGYATKGLLVGVNEHAVSVEGEGTPNETPNNEVAGEEIGKEPANVNEQVGKGEVFSSIESEVAVQNDFLTFKQASEGYLNSLAGKDLDPNVYNAFLSSEYKLFYDENGTLLSNKQDVWGNHYIVFMNAKKQKIIVQSNGGGEGGYVLASYGQNGNIESCTRGFTEGTWNLTNIILKAGETCGGDLQ